MQHNAAVRQPFAEHIGKAEDARRDPIAQHIHVHRNAVFELGQLEKRFHEKFGVDSPAFGFDHDADIFCRFITHIDD